MIIAKKKQIAGTESQTSDIKLPTSTIAIIPARGGSKRIPRKNIKEFCGKPIIAYSIETALKSGLFDRVIVSTDDEKISILNTKLAKNAKMELLGSASFAFLVFKKVGMLSM